MSSDLTSVHATAGRGEASGVNAYQYKDDVIHSRALEKTRCCLLLSSRLGWFYSLWPPLSNLPAPTSEDLDHLGSDGSRKGYANEDEGFVNGVSQC